MIYFQWLLVAMIVVVSLVGGYYQLQIISYLKDGKRSSTFTWGWIFHPEYLEDDGLIYRKRMIGCLVLMMGMIALIKILGW